MEILRTRNEGLIKCAIKAKDTSSRRTKTRTNQHGPVFELVKENPSAACFDGREAILVRATDGWLGWLPKDELESIDVL